MIDVNGVALEIIDESGDALQIRHGEGDQFNYPSPRLEVVLDDAVEVHLDRERVEAVRDFCDRWLLEHVA